MIKLNHPCLQAYIVHHSPNAMQGKRIWGCFWHVSLVCSLCFCWPPDWSTLSDGSFSSSFICPPKVTPGDKIYLDPSVVGAPHHGGMGASERANSR